MDESNIFFVTNTYNYGGECFGEIRNKFNERKGDFDFFRQVKDYNALIKLKNSSQMHGNTNTAYYIFSSEQIHIIDPEFVAVTVNTRSIDPKTEKENKEKDKEYGYIEDNDYHPLIEEIIIDEEELSYADEILGKWEKVDHGIEKTEGNPFGIYIKQKIKKDNSSNVVKPSDAGFQDIDDRDPYYYIYEDTAKPRNTKLGDIDKAKLYEQKYGSIFRVFSDVSQEDIIQSPDDEYLFVNAGPGTGKTYTLMQKIIYMVNVLGVNPEEILVLCFTNAAVNEIKERMRRYAEEHRDWSFINVDVRTFHSFSWLLISQANEAFHDRDNYTYIDMSRLKNYDVSIWEATKIVRKFGSEVFGACSHLIVDEIQDLTNERASLVLSMVRECIKNKVGVTVLGDSCQAIYDYDDEDTNFDLKSDRFYKYLFSEFFDNGKFYKLEKNHRQNEWLISIAQPLRLSILEGKKAAVKDRIEIVKADVPSFMEGSLSMSISPIQIKKLTESGTVCLMCRNNAQVLATSTNLRKRGIEHIVNAYNEFEYLSGWIGKLFAINTNEIINFEDFEKKLKRIKCKHDAATIWERLQDTIGSKNNVLRKQDILTVIAKSKVDDPVFRNLPQGKLIVSNIHKSKGREYDTVILERKFINRLINESTSFKSVPEYLGEAKTLYVAVTRPKNRLYINNLASTDVSLKIIKTGRKRWVRGDGSKLKNLEVRALSDVDMESFNEIDVQRYIINSVSDGDEINLVLDTNTRTISYNIMHIGENGERRIGKCSQDFIDDIDAIISPYGSPWPKRITDLYVSGVHSHISSDYRSTWCWVDFCGLGFSLNDAY